MFLGYTTTYRTYLLQSSESEENRGFSRWIDPCPIYLHQQYIYYLQDRIFDLERKVSSGYKNDEDDYNNNGASSYEALYNDSYCTCPNHKNKGPPPLPPAHTPPPAALARAALIHRRHSTMIHIAPVLTTRARGLRRHPTTTTTNNRRLLWRRSNTICYVATLLGRPYLIHMAHPCVL